MPEGIGSYCKRQEDHADLKSKVMDNIDAKQRQTGQEKGKQGAMDRAGNRGPDP
jgi:hypothetical protein